MPVFENLTTLSIKSVMIQGWQAMPVLLRSCPRLESLYIGVQNQTTHTSFIVFTSFEFGMAYFVRCFFLFLSGTVTLYNGCMWGCLCLPFKVEQRIVAHVLSCEEDEDFRV